MVTWLFNRKHRETVDCHMFVSILSVIKKPSETVDLTSLLLLHDAFYTLWVALTLMSRCVQVRLIYITFIYFLSPLILHGGGHHLFS